MLATLCGVAQCKYRVRIDTDENREIVMYGARGIPVS